MSELPDATGDWRDLRYAAEQAEPNWNALPDSERTKLWDFVSAFLDNFPRLRARCIGCRKQYRWSQIYRCFDCHAPLCGSCIKPHCNDERAA